MKKINSLQPLDSILHKINESKQPLSVNEAEMTESNDVDPNIKEGDMVVNSEDPKAKPVKVEKHPDTGLLGFKTKGWFDWMPLRGKHKLVTGSDSNETQNLYEPGETDDTKARAWWGNTLSSNEMDALLTKHDPDYKKLPTHSGKLPNPELLTKIWKAEGQPSPMLESFDPKSYTKETAERIGNLVEYMDMNVSTSKKPAFQKIIEPACDAVDPNSDLSIAECFVKMGDQKAREILGDLLASNLEVNWQDFGMSVAESINEAAGPEVTFFDVQFGLGHAAQEGLIEKEDIDTILSEIKTNRIKVDELKKLLSKTGKVDKIMDLINKGAEGADMSESADGIALPGSNLYLYGRGMDTNGNSVVRVGFPNRRGFSIQTKGDLPNTDKILSGGTKVAALSSGDLSTISTEITAHVKEHGSEEQKKLINGRKANESAPDVSRLMEIFGVSEILAKNIQNIIDARKENGGDKAEFLGAISAIISKPVAQVIKLVKQVDTGLLDDTTTVNEGLDIGEQGGFSSGVWAQPVLKGYDDGYGYVNHKLRSPETDKIFETECKKAGLDDFQTACFAISQPARQIADFINEGGKNTFEKELRAFLPTFKRRFKKEDWVDESLKMNESVDHGTPITVNESYGQVLDELQKAFDKAVDSMKGSSAGNPKEIWIDLGLRNQFCDETGNIK